MENQQLRAIILKLQDRLSDNDRIRLHFFLGNDVPRRIRDDPSLAGTLALMDSLFDQDKINENDFSFLIHAFDQIQCIDAVKLLKEHKRRMSSNSLNTQAQSLTTIMPSFINQISADQEDDGFSSVDPLLQNDDMTSTNVEINSSRMNNFVYSFKKVTKSITSIYFIVIFILSLLFLISMIKIKQLKIDNKTKTNLIVEQNQTIDDLRKQLIQSENEKNNSLIKSGQKFGGLGGHFFDDSILPSFTFSYYLSGLIVSNDPNDSDSCQFIYSSIISNQTEIKSNVHGKYGKNIDLTQRYTLNYDERFYKVQIHLFDLEFILENGTRFTTQLIRSLVFFTTKGRIISSHSYRTHTMFTEQFDGYTIGYVTGQSGQCIDQLQFFWYRTSLN